MSKFSILIVDDSEADRAELAYMLEKSKLNIKISEVDDGQKALNFISNNDITREKNKEDFPPTIIFLDINMPYIDGYMFLEGFKKIKNNLNVGSCYVIIYTSTEKKDDRMSLLFYDFVVDFMIKGKTSPEKLKEKISFLKAS